MTARYITDDARAAIALRHLAERDRARGNAEAYADGVRPSAAMFTMSIEWATWWLAKADEHEHAALAILPDADSWVPCAPAYVGGA